MPPRHAKAELDIAAPIELVYRVMVDVRAYSAWNPFVVDVEGAPEQVEIGNLLRLHVRWSDGGSAKADERVTRLSPPRDGRAEMAYRFSGFLDDWNLVRGERVQTLTSLPGGQTRYYTEELFSGLLVAFLPFSRVQDGFERHARALRARAEQLSKG